jgi:hypothetical protein
MGGNPSVWFVAAIILFIGADMFVNARGMAAIPRKMTAGIRQLHWLISNRMMGMPALRSHWEAARLHEPTPGERLAYRFAGAVVIAIGLLVAVSQN